jgi:GT2 family glycosyltransferase
MKVVAGLLHYRFWPQVRATLDAVLGQTRPPDELFVLDHCSADGSAERIREAYPGLEVIEAPENRGPIGGLNHMLGELYTRDADAYQVLTHNAKLAPDALERLAARLEDDPGLGAVGPLLGYLDRPETVYFGGGWVHPRSWDVKITEHPEAMSDWDGREPQEAGWLEFAGLLMRAEAARATGLMFEGYYYHYDDPDFTVRMRKLGWRLACEPAARGWKQPGDRSSYLEVRNRLGFVARTAPRRVLAREVVRVLFYLARDSIRRPDGVSGWDLWGRARGLIDFARGRWGAPPASVSRRLSSRHG